MSLSYPVTKNAWARVHPGDRARDVLRTDRGRLGQCLESEWDWYAILRARELVGCDPRRTLEMTERALGLVPKSVEITTLQARLLGTVEGAKLALALDPSYLPAQLALASALLDAGQLREAEAVLRKIPRPQPSEANGLKARVRLARDDNRGALHELRKGSPALGTDFLLLEPTAGLHWPWNDDQVQALAAAELGKADDAAQMLTGGHVGTLPELRTALAKRTKAAERLMNGLERLLVEMRDAPEVSIPAAVSLARMRFMAGQADEALSLLRASSGRQVQFCATLPEFNWILSSGGAHPVPDLDRMRSACVSSDPKAKPLGEPSECLAP